MHSNIQLHILANAINICMLEYRLVSKKGEGTFSEVLKAQSIKTGKYVAIKCMKNHFDTIDQVTPPTQYTQITKHTILIGQQSQGNPGSEKTVASCPNN
jgi:serine/threonine protein kinase